MTEHLPFSADATLIDRIGRELVAKQETALVELVKNGYDADATEVKVTINGNSVTIDDNGTGMNRTQLVEGFLRLATSMKVEHPVSDRYRRPRAGKKGIGRFSTQRLGSYLKLQTWTNDAPSGLELRVNWDKFARGVKLDDVTVEVDEIPPRREGTLIEITGLRDEWSDQQIKRCWRAVRNLQQPFPVAPVDQRPTADPGFEASFYRTGELFSDPLLVADFQTEILDHMHAVVEFRVDHEGQAQWRVSENKFGATTSWTAINDEAPDAPSPPPYRYLRSAWLKAYYAILDPIEFSGMTYTRVREVLADEGGIRLYRNGFRVIPYGEQDDDWLGLDATYVRRNVLVPIANRQWLGVIDVHDPEGVRFEEHTSREGLIETPALRELRSLASSVLVTAATMIASQRGRKTRAGSSRAPGAGSDALLRRLREATRSAHEAARADGESLNSETTGAVLAALDQAESVVKEIIAEQTKDYADQSAILQLLATLGLTAAEFSHETGMTFQASGAVFDRVLRVAMEAKAGDNEFLTSAETARSMFERLDALTSYLNDVASARAARELHPVSLSGALEKFKRGIGPVAEKAEIEFEVKYPPLDGLHSSPMHEAEVASILLNFYSNSAKAVKNITGKRKIFVEGLRESEEEIVLRFSDSGDGIAPQNREKIFGLFFTTRPAAPAHSSGLDDAIGTGLGLWIVHQIVNRAKGEVEVVDAPSGFTTCLEVRLPAEKETI
ncbi:sensor histidine kinase [Nostoc ellipsosporum NOK]|nr:sensor histidine kinase [Nostoc ellipsosporum NOK]